MKIYVFKLIFQILSEKENERLFVKYWSNGYEMEQTRKDDIVLSFQLLMNYFLVSFKYFAKKKSFYFVFSIEWIVKQFKLTIIHC